MSQTVTYWDAWSLWAGGADDLKGKSLWGVQVLWWGRIGKFAALPSGLLLLLDIIGPERLRERRLRRVNHLKDHRRDPGKEFARMFITATVATFVITFATYPQGRTPLYLPLMLVVAAAIWVDAPGRAMGWYIGLLEKDRVAKVLRVFALASLLTGFHFDVLAS